MARTTVRVRTKVPWAIRQAAGGNWVGVCVPLGLTLQSDTWASLMEDIGLALDALLRNLLESGDLDRFLRNQGWELASPIPKRRENIRFDVPFIPELVPQHGAKNLLYQ
jgi:hypothetical protein